MALVRSMAIRTMGTCDWNGVVTLANSGRLASASIRSLARRRPAPTTRAECDMCDITRMRVVGAPMAHMGEFVDRIYCTCAEMTSRLQHDVVRCPAASQEASKELRDITQMGKYSNSFQQSRISSAEEREALNLNVG